MLDYKIKESQITIEKGDLTLAEIEAIVFYASHNLSLGSGFGNAIAVRGGVSIQEELDKLGNLDTCEAVITAAGNLKSNYIIHAVGPRFQEADIEIKYRKTLENILKIVEEKKIKEIGFPPMGTGFYGISLELSARVMREVFDEHLSGNTSLKKISIYLADNREISVFKSVWARKV
ncbi:MAG: macro domain-containing protein [Ignavibacteria bacterium]